MERMKVQCCVRSNDPPERLDYLKRMNISNCYLMFTDEHSNYDDANRAIDRVRKAGITLHIKELAGKNSHHIIEGCFKSFARSLRKAVAIDPACADELPSTKGVLG